MGQQHHRMVKNTCQVFLQTKNTVMKANKSISKAKVYCYIFFVSFLPLTSLSKHKEMFPSNVAIIGYMKY